jgi:hypothetical protein
MFLVICVFAYLFKLVFCIEWRGVGSGLSPDPWFHCQYMRPCHSAKLKARVMYARENLYGYSRGPLIYIYICGYNIWRIAFGRGGLNIYFPYDSNPGAWVVMPVPNQLNHFLKARGPMAPCAQEPRRLGAGAPLTVLRFVPVRGYARDWVLYA